MCTSCLAGLHSIVQVIYFFNEYHDNLTYDCLYDSSSMNTMYASAVPFLFEQDIGIVVMQDAKSVARYYEVHMCTLKMLPLLCRSSII